MTTTSCYFVPYWCMASLICRRYLHQNKMTLMNKQTMEETYTIIPFLQAQNTESINIYRQTVAVYRANEMSIQQIWKWYHNCCGPGSVVGIATGYGLDGPGIESRWEKDFPHLSRPALGHTQPPVQWILGLSQGKEQLGRDIDPPPPSGANVKEEYIYTSTPRMGHTACKEPQCLYKGELYLFFYHNFANGWVNIMDKDPSNHLSMSKMFISYFKVVHSMHCLINVLNLFHQPNAQYIDVYQ